MYSTVPLTLTNRFRLLPATGSTSIVRRTSFIRRLKTYLDQSAQLQFLSPDDNRPPQLDNGVHLLIGDFEELGEKGRDARIILIGNPSGTADSDVIHLETEGVRSIAALKLCQRLINRFESPNMADMVVYDLETTGINPKTAEIVEIAAHRLSAIGDEIERYYCLVKPPGGHIPRSATRIHQIDAETVKDSPELNWYCLNSLGLSKIGF